jgi:molybdenum cofactor cytidylyltransferase
MGLFKPLLPFGDSTVIESCVANLLQAGVDELIVVLGHRAEDIQQKLKTSAVKFAFNPDPGSEMSASIKCGVEQIGPDRKATLIALVDQPAVSAQTISQLIAGWRHTHARLMQPEHDGRAGHPVLIDLVYRNELLTLDPERGLKELFDTHRTEVRRIAVDCPFIARDMDTWEDYIAVHVQFFGFSPKQI